MFVRKKKNPSGIISVQIIDKSSGRYKMLKTIGSSNNLIEIDQFVNKGKAWIKQKQGILEFDFTSEKKQTEQFLDNIEQVNVKGISLLLGNLFDQIGFNQIKDKLFEHLVIYRLCFPVSKLETVDYLKKYQSILITKDKVY